MVNRSIILTSMDLPTSKPVTINEYKSDEGNKNKDNNGTKFKLSEMLISLLSIQKSNFTR